MTIAKEHLEADKRVKYSLFLDSDGHVKPEISARYPGLNPSLVLSKAMVDALPNRIPFDNPNSNLAEISEWMKENVHDGWNVLILNGQTCMVFARDTDAIHFKMAWT